MKTHRLILLLVASITALSLHANPVIKQLQESYRSSGVATFAPDDGKALWYSEHNGRSCTSCHGSSPIDMGKHQKTGKEILPMAPSVNQHRFTIMANIEKWFLRNCKWTLGRECSPQEKGDILQWLQQR